MRNSNTNQSAQTNEWSLITGASSGIGLAFANQLASQKHSLILVARNRSRLTEIAQVLTQRHKIAIKIISADLSTSGGINKVLEETAALSVNLLLNNAGKEEAGEFLNLETTEMLNSIALNCSAPLLLSHHFAKKMAAQGNGNIIFLASIVAFQGIPLIANYAAIKSYILTFAEGMALELEPKGVNVSIVAAGFTRSNLAPSQNLDALPFKPMEAEFVAQYTLEKMGKKLIIIPGFINKFLFYSGKYLQSRRMNSKAFGKVFKLVTQDKLKSEKTVGVK